MDKRDDYKPCRYTCSREARCSGFSFNSATSACTLYYRGIVSLKANSSSTSECYSFYRGNTTRLFSHPLAPTVPIIFRSPIPHRQPPPYRFLEMKKQIQEANRARKAVSSIERLNQHPVYYFEMFQRLKEYHERGGYSDMHWDRPEVSNFTADVVEEITSTVAEEFLNLFCSI